MGIGLCFDIMNKDTLLAQQGSVVFSRDGYGLVDEILVLSKLSGHVLP